MIFPLLENRDFRKTDEQECSLRVPSVSRRGLSLQTCSQHPRPVLQAKPPLVGIGARPSLTQRDIAVIDSPLVCRTQQFSSQPRRLCGEIYPSGGWLSDTLRSPDVAHRIALPFFNFPLEQRCQPVNLGWISSAARRNVVIKHSMPAHHDGDEHHEPKQNGERRDHQAARERVC